MKYKILIILCCFYTLFTGTIGCVMNFTEKSPKFDAAHQQTNEKNLTLSQNHSELRYNSIVVGEYVKTTVIMKKDFADEVLRTNDLGQAVGGRVYTFKQKKFVCDDNPNEVKETSKDSFLFFFNPQNSGFYQPFNEGKNYLIFLVPLPKQNQLQAKYNLEPKTVYHSLYSISDKKKFSRIKEGFAKLDDENINKLKQKYCK